MTTKELVNDTRFADLSKDVIKLGKDAAMGVDALPKLALAIATAAFDRVVDLEPKHPVTRDGKSINVDDADVLYDLYQKSDGKKQFGDYKTASRKAQVSKLRTIVKAGLNTNCELPKVLDQAAQARKKLAETKVKVLSAYPAFVSVATMQRDMDRPMNDAEIEDAVTKAAPEAGTITDYVKRLQKGLDKLISGENSDGLKCQDEHVIKAFEELTTFLKVLEARETMEGLFAQAAAMGLTIVPSVPAITAPVTVDAGE